MPFLPILPTLSGHATRSILHHLDQALASTREDDCKRCGTGYEGNASWRIRLAREALLEVAIGDVAVEQIQAAA